ncbi:DUF4214 domain-containing protein [Sulfitobacter mediterraneus]|uniref:Uncharacterized protein DUF4214 n=1 Tax=Sulfitobacter mediterraneus TaxID=83219 RepID=A0A2T6C0Q9_9RHOB|nr:DUF4214 domain-containing protein [Sulfitobacter mediterraneus]KIN75682.1 Peptidase S8 and S53 subtilisin kexin sedolisin [Sulfitobacter mediterraneus KCTC 32188]PTX61899.1 uncharacterized protein DUF4214 [Sulfitobacter mediterraneus]
MAFLTSLTFGLTGDSVVDAATQGGAWNLSQTNVINWSLADGYFGEFWISPADAITQIDLALNFVEAYANIDFVYTGYFDNPDTAWASGSDITFSLDGTGLITGDSWAVGHFPNSPNAVAAGDIFLNINSEGNFLPSYEAGSQGFFLILHETFHALGLKHTHDDGGSGRPTLSDLGLADINQDWFSVMSYNDELTNDFSFDPATPMLLDVFGLQYLYGANLTIDAGDTTHEIADADLYYTIWDPSGVDWIDITNQQEGWYVELPNTILSDINPVLTGVALPSSDYEDGIPNAPRELVWLMGDIENVSGSPHIDEIHGNRLANSLQGFGGNDLIDGGEGADTAVYSGNQTSYTLALSPTGTSVTDRRADGNGTDTLIDIEFLDFDTDLFGSPFNLDVFAGPAGLTPAQLESFIELYIAYFNRAPDAVGLNFWGTQFANGLTLDEMAALFGPQDETLATYPVGTANDVFATTVYNNVLGRTPDQAGIDFWVGQLDSGNVSRDQFILQVLQGAKSDLKPELGQDFVDQQIADQAFLETKTDIGAYFAVHKGMSDTANASAAMALFDGSAGGTNAAVAAIDGFYADALDAENGEFLMPLVGVLDDPFLV